jgi:hypothetical protein
MNIFDPLISGSLSVSGSGEISGDLTVLGTIFGAISGTSQNAISASHAANYTLTSSFGSFTSSYTTGSFTGSFGGDGSNLTNIPASGVTGLNLNKIVSGSVSASISPNDGFQINADTKITGALLISGSITLNGVPVGTGKLDETTFYSYTSSVTVYTGETQTTISTLATTASVNSLSTSIATTTSNLDDRLDNVETSTGSLNTFTSSINTTIKSKLDSDGVISGSVQVDITSTTNYTSFSSSIATTDSNQNTRLGLIETSTGSLNSFTSSIDTTIKNKLNSDGVISGSSQILNGTTIHSGTFFNGISVVSGSAQVDFAGITGVPSGIVSGSSQVNFSGITGVPSGIVSGSAQVDITATTNYTTFSSSISSSIGDISSSIATTNLNQNNRLGSLETSTGSLNTFTSSINTTIKDKLNSESVISGSIQVDITSTTGYSTFSSSIASTDLLQGNRLTSIEGLTGSYATTGSNIFIGSQTITGSLYVSQNLIVQGESSLENLTASAVSIGTNKIILNSDSPAIRYAGISVFDSGSTNVTASLLYDSLTNNWKFQHTDVGTDDSSILLYGPLGVGIDNAPTLTSNFLTKVEDNGHGHHLTTSSIFHNGSKVAINNNTEVTGSLTVTGNIISTITSLVSGSSQVSFNGITDKPTLVSGSSQITYGSLTGIPSGIVSGSAQVSFNGITDKPALVSGSSQITYGSLTGIPSGIVSGSSQITYGSLTGIPSGIVSGSAQISFNGIVDKPTLVSGSSQITLTSGQVTTGLGFTPYNATNPNGYTTNTGTVTSVGGTGTVSGLSLSGTVTTSGNLTLGGTLTLTSGQITTGLGFTPYNATNPSGYITGITSGNVTTALGFTPYNATNPSGYISSITSGNVTTALGYTPYNATNPNGYITGISFANVSSKPTTISGYGITDAITTGNIGSQTVTNSSQLNGLSKIQLWNNSGQNHTTYTSFGAIPNFGVWFMQGSSAGDSPQSGSQYYVQTQGLGNEYSYGTSAGNYGFMTAVARDHAVKYTYYRTLENGAWGSWSKGAAGYADSAGSATTAGNITAYTVNQNVGTGNGVTFAGLTVNGNVNLGSSNGHTTRINDILYVGASDSGDSHFYFGEDSSGWYGSYWYWDSAYTHNWYSRDAGTNTLLMYHDTRQTTNVYFQRNILPTSNNAYNLGSASLGWANVYTNDLHLSNMNKPEGNDIDGTKGTWTIQEGDENLYIINNNNGKKFKISLEEIL